MTLGSNMTTLGSIVPSIELKVQEIRHPDSVFTFEMRWWHTIKDVKDLIRRETHAKPSQLRIFHPQEPVELRNTCTLHDIGLDTGGMLRVAIDGAENANFVLSYSNSFIDKKCLEMVKAIESGLARNKIPAKSDILDGTSGVYFMRSITGAYVSVFKPRDEEQGMPNNPKDHCDVGDASLRDDFKPGEGCFREQAAYILDVDNFCRVPPTVLVHCEHSVFNYPNHSHSKQSGKQIVKPFPKYGSMQLYVRSEDSFENFGRNFFSDIEVQRIALLDIRLLNCDRNSANILVYRKTVQDEISCNSSARSSPSSFNDADEDTTYNGNYDDADMFETGSSPHHSGDDYYLVPIDHGYALPCRVKIFQWDWAWFDYDQVNRPVCPEIRAYIKSLNIDRILTDLGAQVFLPDSFFPVRVAHQLLVEGIESGSTLRDIADIIAREDEDTPSRLEMAIIEAEDNTLHTLEAHWGSLGKGGRLSGGDLSTTRTPPRNGSQSQSQPAGHSREPQVDGAPSQSSARLRGSAKGIPSALLTVQELDGGVDLGGNSGVRETGEGDSDALREEGVTSEREKTISPAPREPSAFSSFGKVDALSGQALKKITTIDPYQSPRPQSDHSSATAAAAALGYTRTRVYKDEPPSTNTLPPTPTAPISNDTNTSQPSVTLSTPTTSGQLTRQVAFPASYSAKSKRGGLQGSSTSADLQTLVADSSSRASPTSDDSRGPSPSAVQAEDKQAASDITAHPHSHNHGPEYDPLPFSRAVSFTSLESAPLFDLKSLNKHRANAVLLKRQRNKQFEATSEYREQRLKFTTKTVSVLISRVAKQLNRKNSI